MGTSFYLKEEARPVRLKPPRGLATGFRELPGPSSDPSPWLRPTAANIYIFKVNSLKENLPGAGEAILLWPVVTGPS